MKATAKPTAATEPRTGQTPPRRTPQHEAEPRNVPAIFYSFISDIAFCRWMGTEPFPVVPPTWTTLPCSDRSGLPSASQVIAPA